MPEKLFLFDYKTNRSISYKELLNDLNRIEAVREYCYTRDLYSTLLTIIAAILRKVNLVLLDADFTESELAALQISAADLQRERQTGALNIADTAQLLHQIQENPGWELTLFTSGTTGVPKRVVHTLKSLTRAVRIADKHADAVWGFAYNPTHIAGLQVFMQALLNANTLVNLFEAPRELVLVLIKNYGIINISATPTFFRLLMPLQEAYPSVRKLTSGGEKFDTNLNDSLLKAFPNARLRNVYASTEAGTILESIDDTFSIADETQCRIKDGELHIHRLLLGKGAELTLVDGEWYATGDLVEVAGENPLHFRFLQRKNEMINVGGYKVNPYEVEQVIETHQRIRQAYVYGKASPLLGSILMADVIAIEAIREKELREFLAPLLQPYKIPRIINFVDSIELTRSGKLKRTL